MPSDSEQYCLSPQAHVKLLMHALKYPYACVNGFLLTEEASDGKKWKQGKSSGIGDETTGNRIDIVDAIPLFHLGHGLTPMIEVALLQVSAYCKERSLQIGGLYFGNKHFRDSSPDIFSQKIAEKIVEQNSSAVLLLLDNMGLASAMQEEADAESVLHLHLQTDGKWKQKSGLLKLEDSSVAFKCVNDLILNQGLQLHIKDFDNHLDDISNDWTNKAINHKINTFVQS